MKQKKQQYDDLNCTEQKARELFEYDEDSLLAEMDEAERAWEAEKTANPEAAAQVLRAADEGFAKLMAHIKAKGIQPVSEEEYEKEYQKERQKNIRTVVRLGRGRRKVLLLAAAVCVLGLGTTMVVSAHREYKFNVYPTQEKQNVLIKHNAVLKMDNGSLEDAYKSIELALGIKVLRLGHIPNEMKLKQVIINDEHAVLEFEYKGKRIYLKEEIQPESGEMTQSDISDRVGGESIQNSWLNKSILLEKNMIGSDEVEYSANINTEEACYYLSGIIGKTEFISLLQGLCY